MSASKDLAEMLEQHRGELIEFVRRHGARLLGFESEGDLAHGVIHRALASAERFEVRSDAEFFGWIYTLARRHLADRSDYWFAKKRGAARLLRLTQSESSDDLNAAMAPAADSPGPLSIAIRRELLQLALASLAALPERDRKLVRWASESVSIEDRAANLGISYDAAQRATHRAMERFRKTFELAQRRRN